MIMCIVLTVAALLFAALPAAAQQGEDEAKIRAVIAEWYERVAKQPADMPWVLFAPGSIDGGPGYSVAADLNSGSRVLRGPWINHELAAQALKFTYDIDLVKVDPRFAKVYVWERGYFYAWAARTTYENAASTLFILEKQPDTDEWKILVHDARSTGIPSNKVTEPMPDLRELYYSRCASCDPVADARKASE
jgi:hypothetical protein